jgi:hypothetical protein
MAKGGRRGEPGRKHLLEQCEVSTNEVVVLFDPVKLVYEVKSSRRTNVGGEVLGERILRVEIGDMVSCTCMTRTLLHLPCSHVIIVCHMRCVLHEGSNYISPYYSLSAERRHGRPDLSLCLTHRSGRCMRGRNMYRKWPCERCRRGDGRRSASITRWMIWRRVMAMICMVQVTSTKSRIKYIVPSLTVKATP